MEINYIQLFIFLVILHVGDSFWGIGRYWNSINPPVHRTSMVESPSIWNSFVRGYRQSFTDDTLLSVTKLIKSDGYPLEIHHTVTNDGYIIELHRIPHGQNMLRSKYSPVVLMGHCLYCASDAFVVPGKNKALAYLMAEMGYDVWLLNARGTTYSTNHTRLSTNSEKFWDFSWHEIGYYDLPASIDYILDNTGAIQMDYIGYSMGTTIFFVLMSERPEYNKKVRRMAALAPSAYGSFLRGPFSVAAPFLPLLELVEDRLDLRAVPPKSLSINRRMVESCRSRRLLQRAFCDALFVAFQGSLPKNIDEDLLSNKFLRYFPNTGSLHTITHYHQRFNSGKFRRFEHSRDRNLRTYGRSDPPEYNLTKVTVPVGLFWSEVDGYTSRLDIGMLKRTLPNSIHEYKITDPNFDHGNFVWDKDVVSKLYTRVIKFMVF